MAVKRMTRTKMYHIDKKYNAFVKPNSKGIIVPDDLPRSVNVEIESKDKLIEELNNKYIKRVCS